MWPVSILASTSCSSTRHLAVNTVWYRRLSTDPSRREVSNGTFPIPHFWISTGAVRFPNSVQVGIGNNRHRNLAGFRSRDFLILAGGAGRGGGGGRGSCSRQGWIQGDIEGAPPPPFGGPPTFIRDWSLITGRGGGLQNGRVGVGGM